MSKRTSEGLAFTEKLLGMIIALLGAILMYQTYGNRDIGGIATAFFIGGGLLLIIVGAVLLIAKAE